MTNKEYQKRLRQSRSKAARQQIRTNRILKKIYLSAAEETAKVVAAAEYAGASSLTIQSQAAIEENLRAMAAKIADQIPGPIQECMEKSYSSMALVDSEYVADAATAAGVQAVTLEGMKNVTVAVNDRLVRAIVGRLYSDGVTFSERVWKAANVYDRSIAQVVAQGVASGRDAFEIAGDIAKYAKDGRVALAKRYGKIEAGSKEWIRRMPKQVDYRALRLARSEVSNGLQEAGKESARINPGATDEVEWLLTPGVQHDCVCLEYAEIRVFKIDEVPEYPHANCMCHVEPILRPQADLVYDLKRWQAGEFVPRMEEWYRNVYLSANG